MRADKRWLDDVCANYSVRGGSWPEGTHVYLYTWGIGGARVGRPSDARPTPVGRAEGLDHDSVASAAASGHTVLVGQSGTIYSCGRNDSAGGGGHGSPAIKDSGQLGRDGPMNRFLPVLGALDGQNVVGAACGRYHTAAVTAEGQVHTFGLNDRGQLGRPGIMGEASTQGCICDSGGSCKCAQDGAEPVPVGSSCIGGSSCRSGLATPVTGGAMRGARAVAVAAGRYTTAALLDDGIVVVGGLNMCGAAEHKGVTASSLMNNANLAATPRKVGGKLADEKVIALDVGYVHMAMVTESGKLYTCDTGFDGYANGLGQAAEPNKFKQLGRRADTQGKALSPGVVHGSLHGRRVIAAATGRCHVAAITDDGALHTFGCAALGHSGGGKEPEEVPRVASAGGAKAVGAGEYFTLVATKDGAVLGWGDGGSGQLGKQLAPGPVHDPMDVPVGEDGEKVVLIFGGYQHAMAVVEAAT